MLGSIFEIEKIMATWDGSYSGPDDQNYYMYSDQNVPAPTTGNWTYFPNAANNDYSQTNRELFARGDSTYEQNCPSTFYQSNMNAMPNLLPPANNYQEPLRNTAGSSQTSNNLEYFPTANPQQCYAPMDYWRNDVKPTRGKPNFARKADESKQFNLHAMAEEFVPNNDASDDGRQEPENVNTSSSVNSTDFHAKEMKSVPRSSDKYSSYDASKYERRYDNKRNTNYKPKEGYQDSYERNTYRNSYQQQGRVPHKYQGNRYYTNKHYLDKLQPVAKDKNALSSDCTNNDNTCSIERTSTTISSVEEPFFNVDSSIKSKKSSVENSNKGAAIVKEDAVQRNEAKYYNNHAREFSSYNSGSKQSYSQHRNAKKYSYNGRHSREETGYREKRRNYQGYNGTRDAHSKEDKFDTKEQTYHQEEPYEFKNNCSEEPGSGAKEMKKKRYNYQMHNGFREQGKGDKTEGFKERDRGKNYAFENKERGSENWRSKKDGNERSGTQKWGQNKKALIGTYRS